MEWSLCECVACIGWCGDCDAFLNCIFSSIAVMSFFRIVYPMDMDLRIIAWCIRSDRIFSCALGIAVVLCKKLNNALNLLWFLSSRHTHTHTHPIAFSRCILQNVYSKYFVVSILYTHADNLCVERRTICVWSNEPILRFENTICINFMSKRMKKRSMLLMQFVSVTVFLCPWIKWLPREQVLWMQNRRSVLCIVHHSEEKANDDLVQIFVLRLWKL